MTSALALTFHAIEATSRPSNFSRDTFGGLYTISKEFFEQIIDAIPSRQSCTVSEFIKRPTDDLVVLTFDDGYISDFEIVFPILLKKGIRATFFVTVGNIGLPGYTSISHLKEMAKAGMEIGNHGLTHRYLTSMTRNEAIREICESKSRIEKNVDLSINSFAPVGGHYHHWMFEVAAEAGYHAFATMIPGKTIQSNKRIVLLRRNHIQDQHNMNYVSRLLRGHKRTFFLNKLKYTFLFVSKAILGMHNYDQLKDRILKFF
jgi:peptidoglycan/xylan/chitin deacetylase (PgdA/CDA1 family)